AIRQREEGRIKSDSVFEQISANTRLLSELNDKVYTLNLKKYQEEQKQIKEIVQQIDKLTKTDKANPVELLPSDVSRFSNDQAKLERQQQWLKNLKSDIYLNETVSIVNNIISHNAIVRSK
ncbi:MAG TPA: carboxy terminal-processing peptidase, partial [Agriterribacter sp.]|nr:carboxy terminal-processing peptidase [Agriterribacter sp.]